MENRKKFIQQYVLKDNFINVYCEIFKRKHIRRHIEKEVITRLLNNVIYLDIGCGTGKRTTMFIDFLKKFGFNVNAYGIDLNYSNIKHAKNLGINAMFCDIEKDKPPLNNVDIITCFEVIEHVYDTDSFIENIYNTLNDSGILLISTPNTVSWKNRLSILLGVHPLNLEVSLKRYYGLKFFKKFYRDYVPAGHIRGFTPLSLKEMLEDNGFEVLSVCGIENWRLTGFLDYIPSLATNFIIIAIKSM